MYNFFLLISVSGPFSLYIFYIAAQMVIDQLDKDIVVTISFIICIMDSAQAFHYILNHKSSGPLHANYICSKEDKKYTVKM